MGFYREAVAVTPRAKGNVKIRLSDSLGVISLQNTYPSSLSPSPASSGSLAINVIPTSSPMMPAATPSTSSSGTSSITPGQVTNPVTPGGVYAGPSTTTRYASGTETPTGGGNPVDTAGAAAAAAAPIIAATAGPAAGAAAALGPAIAQAYNAPDMTRIAFDSTPSFDMSMPEVYNADGTPATPTAQAQTILQKISALPPAAKIGGVVVLYLLFSRR